MGGFFAIVLALFLVLAFFTFLSWLAYLVLYLPTNWLINSNRRKIVRLVLSPLTVILVLVIYFNTHGPSNDDTATIEDVGDGYQITLTGQRLYMVHDPISFLMSETYPDSVTIHVPRANGLINGQELQQAQGHETLGTLKIDNEKINVDLYYENSDDKTKEPFSWNGDYRLKWKSNL
jgi:hypothetical protein